MKTRVCLIYFFHDCTFTVSSIFNGLEFFLSNNISNAEILDLKFLRILIIVTLLQLRGHPSKVFTWNKDGDSKINWLSTYIHTFTMV